MAPKIDAHKTLIVKMPCHNLKKYTALTSQKNFRFQSKWWARVDPTRKNYFFLNKLENSCIFLEQCVSEILKLKIKITWRVEEEKLGRSEERERIERREKRKIMILIHAWKLSNMNYQCLNKKKERERLGHSPPRAPEQVRQTHNPTWMEADAIPIVAEPWNVHPFLEVDTYLRALRENLRLWEV